jgi:hypothetical protein
MGPQQSSSSLLPLLFQSRLPLRCAPSMGLCHNVRHVFAAAARPWRRPKTSEMGASFLGLNL